MAERPVLKAWLELARVSNLPTCVTNVLTGTVIGTGAGGWIVFKDVTAVALAVMLLYVAGMALNDVVDRRVDLSERPGRPIPSGRISARAATVFAVICMAAAFGLLSLTTLPALAFGVMLAATIVAYDLLHKRLAASVVLMGACRGLVYLVAAAAAAWPLPEPHVAAVLITALAAYTTIVTLVARVETGDEIGARQWGVPLLGPVALAPAAVIWPETWLWAAVASVLVVIWLLVAALHVRSRPPNVPRAIMGCLAGMCLVDGFYLSLLDHPGLSLVAVVCFVATALCHRRILGS